MTAVKNRLAHRRTNITQWYDVVQISLLVILFILLPSVNSNELMQGTKLQVLSFLQYFLKPTLALETIFIA